MASGTTDNGSNHLCAEPLTQARLPHPPSRSGVAPLVAGCDELIDGFLDSQRDWASPGRPLSPVRGLAACHVEFRIGKSDNHTLRQEWVRRNPGVWLFFALMFAASGGWCRRGYLHNGAAGKAVRVRD